MLFRINVTTLARYRVVRTRFIYTINRFYRQSGNLQLIKQGDLQKYFTLKKPEALTILIHTRIIY